MIERCPNCQRDVLPMDNGLCPSCRISLPGLEPTKDLVFESGEGVPRDYPVVTAERSRCQRRPFDGLIGWLSFIGGGVLWLAGGSVWFGAITGQLGMWGLLLFPVGFAFAYMGTELLKHGKSRRARANIASRDVLSAQRKFTLYLRPFSQDDEKIEVGLPLGFPSVGKTVEETIVRRMVSCGRFLSLGRPGDKMPPPGAQRIYLSDANWQDDILGLFRKANLILMRVGDTNSVKWEVKTALGEVDPRRFYLYRPDETQYSNFMSGIVSSTSDYKEFRRSMESLFPKRLPEPTEFLNFIGFDEDWKPYPLVDPSSAKHFGLIPSSDPSGLYKKERSIIKRRLRRASRERRDMTNRKQNRVGAGFEPAPPTPPAVRVRSTAVQIRHARKSP